MKPRLFIGSSAEGLAIANAVQANLWRVAEVTIWTQGVFKPSSGTLPALLDSLESQDFGLFVFTPDDAATIRGGTHQIVRDNVIFELGLFVGRVGLDRSYFLIPDGIDLHVATDLLGVTPLKYETGRSDNNFVAAVAPACLEVEAEIKHRGFAQRRAVTAPASTPTVEATTKTEQTELVEVNVADSIAVSATEVEAKAEATRTPWWDAFLRDDFETMRNALAADLNAGKIPETEKLISEAWLAYATFRIDSRAGNRAFERLQQQHPNDATAYNIHQLAYYWADRPDEALVIIDRALPLLNEPEVPTMLVARARALLALGREDEVTPELERAIQMDPPNEAAFTMLADRYTADKDLSKARRVLERGIEVMPKNKPLLSKYAAFVAEQIDKRAAVSLYDSLVVQFPDDPTPRTLRGNLYLALGFNDLAMRDYETANELAKGEQSWIIGNIGNLYNNLGLFTKAVDYLEKANRVHASSSWTHERLGAALRLKEEQIESLRQVQEEGRRVLAKVRAEPEKPLLPESLTSEPAVPNRQH